ncbi:MAG: alpha-amylase family glycosyl hydrolase [Acidimicrobiales bacterium]
MWPRCFADGNGDGVGDLLGVRNRLDYLAWLGIDAIWLSPFYPSPQADYGYDVSDYCNVDPTFGDLDTFDTLVSAAHERGIRVIIDWVPNHTSNAHPWFIEGRRGKSSAKRDFYVWRDSRPGSAEPGHKGQPPNNWGEAFGDGPAWTWDEQTAQWYLHLFLSEQPDLNWHNPQVVAAMHDVVRFWLARGVDGFRIDVVHLIGKDPALGDLPAEKAGRSVVADIDDEATHTMLKELRSLADSYAQSPVLVGEVILLSAERIAEYLGQSDELHLAFNFPALWVPWDYDAWRKQLDEAALSMRSRDGWPTWVLSNHDNPRHRTRYGGSVDRARAAAVLLCTLRGTPFLYAGEELGLEEAVVPAELRRDAGGRDGCRAPFPWEPGPDHGWSPKPEWPVWPPEANRRNVASLRQDPSSILHLYRRVLALRKASPALRSGSMKILPSPSGVLVYARRNHDEVKVVMVNFSDQAQVVVPTTEWPDAPRDGWTIEVDSSQETQSRPYDNGVASSGALILA